MKERCTLLSFGPTPVFGSKTAFMRQYFGHYFASVFVSQNQQWVQNTEDLQIFLLYLCCLHSTPNFDLKIEIQNTSVLK